MTVKALLKAANNLSIDERTVLAHQIWASVEKECDGEPLSDELKAELDRRIALHEKDPSRGSSWEDVEKRLDRKLKALRHKK